MDEDGRYSLRNFYQEPSSLVSHSRLPLSGYLLDRNRIRGLTEKAAALKKASDIVASGPDPPAAARFLSVTRAEIFLTSRCNMACGYCHSTAHAMPEWENRVLEKMLSRMAAAGARHVQWTGGEPTCHPGFLDLVQNCGRLGMTQSVSTNGTAPLSFYRALVREGITRFYVSLDAITPEAFDRTTGTRGLMERVQETIVGLCAGPVGERVHLTVNTMLTPPAARTLLTEGGRPLAQLLDWLCGCGANDFKFLPVTSLSVNPLFSDADTFQRFVAICREKVPQRHAMFHYRLANMAAGSHGIQSAPHHCFFCLDDRAFDSLGAYPCILHLREGGRRLFRHTVTDDEKVNRLAAYFQTDRFTDPVCRTHCFDLYRDLSIEAQGIERLKTI